MSMKHIGFGGIQMRAEINIFFRVLEKHASSVQEVEDIRELNWNQVLAEISKLLHLIITLLAISSCKRSFTLLVSILANDYLLL